MITIGAQYYRPPNPPRQDWARDLGRMREAGLNTVKFWACWSWMAPHEGTVDFADLDELMDLAARNDLGVVVNTILENAPYRLERSYPRARYLDSEDRPVPLGAAMNTPGGGWPGLCFDNESVWEQARSFLTELTTRYRDHPALRVWDVWNEPHLEPASYHPERIYCYCPASLKVFRAWLRTRYTSLDDLNRAWQRRHSAWEEVDAPRRHESVPDMLDWRAFWFDNLRTWLDRRQAAVRRADTAHPVMTHVALSGFTGQLATHTLDEFTLTDSVDLFGTSSFPTWLMADDHVEHLFNLDTARDAAAGKPFWQAELQGGRGRRDGVRSTPHPDPSTVSLWMWNALASGATGIMFWQWRPELTGPEAPGYGLCAPDGAFTDRVAAVRDVATDPDVALLDGWQPDRPSCGLLLSRRSALHAYATDRTMDLYRDAVLGAYRLLIDNNTPVELLHEDLVERDGVPDHLTSLLWPMPSTSSDELADRLHAFVERGGTLVAEAGAGEYDRLGRRRPVVPPGLLGTLFGITQIEPDARTVSTIRLDSGTTLAGRWQRDSLREGTAVTVGRFTDGGPAVTLHQVGEGTAITIATHPGLHYGVSADDSTRAAVVALLDADAHRSASPWQKSVPGLVSRSGVLRDGRRATVVVNWTDEEAPLVTPPGVDEPLAAIPPRTGRLLIP
ncbi:beta-galactosidase [Streptomyces sp. NPDC026672]|uniref:beta-galactosidase n=1 Tax=unclassified Streptomyces TaxID=2593676 RepID=UPI0033EE131B